MENNPFIFGECATEVRDKVQPEGANGARYIGLEHVEQGTLHYSPLPAPRTAVPER